MRRTYRPTMSAISIRRACSASRISWSLRRATQHRLHFSLGETRHSQIHVSNIKPTRIVASMLFSHPVWVFFSPRFPFRVILLRILPVTRSSRHESSSSKQTTSPAAQSTGHNRVLLHGGPPLWASFLSQDRPWNERLQSATHLAVSHAGSPIVALPTGNPGERSATVEASSAVS